MKHTPSSWLCGQSHCSSLQRSHLCPGNGKPHILKGDRWKSHIKAERQDTILETGNMLRTLKLMVHRVNLMTPVEQSPVLSVMGKVALGPRPNCSGFCRGGNAKVFNQSFSSVVSSLKNPRKGRSLRSTELPFCQNHFKIVQVQKPKPHIVANTENIAVGVRGFCRRGRAWVR